MDALLATVPEDADAVGLGNWVATQPAAAAVCLAEAHAGAPVVRERLNMAVAGFEARARERLPGGADFPPKLITAYIGALLEIARHRLRARSRGLTYHSFLSSSATC